MWLRLNAKLYILLQGLAAFYTVPFTVEDLDAGHGSFDGGISKGLPLDRALTRSLCPLTMTLSLFQISADTPSDQQRVSNVLQMSQRKSLME